MADPTVEVGAEFEGLRVPKSPFLNEKFARWINKGQYERPERHLARKLIRPGDKIIELGAGIGFVGGYNAFKAPGSVLRSYEANPALIPHTQALYRLNGLEDRATVRNALLVSDPDAPKTLTFHIHGSYLGSSVYRVGKSDSPKLQIPTEQWENVKAEFQPDVLIMDIEGAELDFVTHADLSGVRAAIVELHPKRYGDEGCAAVIAAFEEQGLKRTHHRWEVRTFVRQDA